jgi:hypothetical protein
VQRSMQGAGHIPRPPARALDKSDTLHLHRHLGTLHHIITTTASGAVAAAAGTTSPLLPCVFVFFTLPWAMDAVGRQSTRHPSHHGRQPEALVAMAEQQRSSDQWRLETCGKRQVAGFDQTQMLSNRRVATTGACPPRPPCILLVFKVLVVMKSPSSRHARVSGM